MESKTERIVTLKSGDGEKLKAEEEVANEFTTLKNCLEDTPYEEAPVLPLPNVAGKFLYELLEFTRESLRMKKLAGGSMETKESHERVFLKGFNDEDLKEMMMVVNYLDNKKIVEMITKELAKRIENKSAKGCAKFFGVECDIPEEELKKIVDADRWAHEGDEIEPDVD